MDFTDLVWLFACDNRNRGIVRMNFDEAALLWNTVKRTGGPILEIGRRLGGSTVLVCAAAAGRKLVSIDIAPRHDPAVEAFLQAPEHASNVELLVADSRYPLSGYRFGLLFIDGDHSYEGVREDTYAHWDALESHDGCPPLVAFHDAVPNDGLRHVKKINHAPGVKQFCEELVSTGAMEVEATAGSLLVARKTGPLPTRD